MRMAQAWIDIDEEALVAAKAVYGTTSAEETVNRALRDVAARCQVGQDRVERYPPRS